MTGHIVALGLGSGHGGRPGGVELNRADHGQIRCLLLDDGGGFLHQIHIRPLARTQRGVGEHADLRVDAEGLGGFGGLDGDVGQLLGVRIQVDRAVGEHGHMILEAHEERAGDQRLAGLGLDDLQRRAHGVGGRVDGTGNQTVGLAEHHQHRAEVAGVGQRGDHRGEHLLVVHGLEGGLLQRVEPQLLAAGQDRVLVANDDQVHDVAFDQIVGRLDDAVLLAFGQHDGLLIGLGLAQQAVLEGVRRNRGGERGLKRGQHLIRGHMLVEDGGRGLCA